MQIHNYKTYWMYMVKRRGDLHCRLHCYNGNSSHTRNAKEEQV
jgi:hypothetical protein